MKKLNIFLLLLIVFLSSCGQKGPQVGDAIPDLVLEDIINNKKVSPKDFEGKEVVLYFGDPFEEKVGEELQELQEYYQGNENKLAVLGIMINTTKQEIERLVRQNELTFPILQATENIGKFYGVEYEPLIIVIGKDGDISYRRQSIESESVTYVMDQPFLRIRKISPTELINDTRKAVEEREGAKIRLIYWRVWEKPEVYESIIAEYEKRHPDVDIVYKQVPYKDYKENLLPSLKENIGPPASPDIFEIHASWLPHYISELAPIPESIYTTEEYINTYHRFVAKAFYANEKMWAIAMGSNVLSLFYNPVIFAEAGLSDKPPETWNEVLYYCEKISRVGKWGLAIGTASTTDQDHNVLEMIAIQKGAEPIARSLGESWVNTTGFVEALKFYTDFVTEYQYWSSSAQRDRVEFMDGKLAMFISGSWQVNALQQRGSTFKIAKVPLWDKDNPYTHATFWGEVVSADCEHSEVAWDFLKFCASSKNMKHFCRETKRPPARKDLVDWTIQDMPILKPFMEQMTYGGMRFKPWEDDWKAAQLEAIQVVVNGVKTPEEALDTAAELQNEKLIVYPSDLYNFTKELPADTTDVE